MIRALTFIAIFLTTSYLSGQSNCNCLSDLDIVATELKQSKSYGVQIRGEQILLLDEWKLQLQKEIRADELADYFCVGYLQKYISFLRDRHNQIYTVPTSIAASTPIYTKALDTINIENDGVSGIYYAGSDKVLVQKDKEATWYGVMLASKSEDWHKGRIRFMLKQNKDATFEIFEFYRNGLLFYQNNLRIEDGRIQATVWNKQNSYYFYKNHIDNISYTSLNDEFDYISIKTFERSRPLIKAFDDFYGTYLDSLNKDNLIIDVRNNGGGSIKQAARLMDYLQRNRRIEKIYILSNFKTASAAEIFILKMKEDERAIVVGESSRGMVEYGYGNKAYTSETDCYGYDISFSTKVTNRKYQQYEGCGIDVDYRLDNSKDWIEQVLDLAP